MADTFERSCEHWSEAGRREMEDFYSLAEVDYRYLAEAHDWGRWICDRHSESKGERLKLLDVACGSGKFPLALSRFSSIVDSGVETIDCDLLDPSAFSIAETRRVLPPPFLPGREFETTLQALVGVDGEYDVAWATHALYAVPEELLATALERMVAALRSGGQGFIAHARSNAHYLRFYRHFLKGFRADQGTPYSTAEQIEDRLRNLGVRVESHTIEYRNRAMREDDSRVEGYLQRCVFDDTVSLDSMLSNPDTGGYLRSCQIDGEWQFSQRVALIFFEAP